eukprot:g6271.t1
MDVDEEEEYFREAAFAEALFKYQSYTVFTKAFWGGVTLIVPPGVAVEQNGQAIMGGFGGTGGVYSAATHSIPQTVRTPKWTGPPWSPALFAPGSESGDHHQGVVLGVVCHYGVDQIRRQVEGTALMGSVSVAVNQRAKPAEFLTPEQVEEELKKAPEPSTYQSPRTRQDMVDEALAKALGGRVPT